MADLSIWGDPTRIALWLPAAATSRARRALPSRVNYPAILTPFSADRSKLFCVAANPTAIGRSNPAPVLRTSAGGRLIAVYPGGKTPDATERP